MENKERVVLVTGGASGLGLACVKRFSKAGNKVIFCDLPNSKGEEIASNLQPEAVFVPCDITVESDVMKVIETARERFGRLDICINCAGIYTITETLNPDSLSPCPQELFEKTFRVNVFGTFNVVRLAAALMAKNEPKEEGGERGVIITTASVAGFEGQSCQVGYAASKAAVIGMTLPLARDLGQFGIRVVSIAPGLMDTPMLRDLTAKVYDYFRNTCPFPKRLGDPAEFAELAETIANLQLLNGETIRMDCGIRLEATFPH